MTSPRPPQRRSTLIAVTAVASVVAVAFVVSALGARAKPQPAEQPYVPPALFAGLTPGTKFESLEVVGGRLLEQGVFRLELKDADGRQLSVEIMRYDAAAPAPQAHTASLALYVLAPPGQAPTAAVVAGLEAVARSLEKAEAGGAAVPPLTSMSAFNQAHPPLPDGG